MLADLNSSIKLLNEAQNVGKLICVGRAVGKQLTRVCMAWSRYQLLMFARQVNNTSNSIMSEDLGSIRREKQRYLKSRRCKTDICVRMSYGLRNARCEGRQKADKVGCLSFMFKTS